MYNVTHTQNINYDISISTYTYDILGYAFALKSGSGARHIYMTGSVGRGTALRGALAFFVVVVWNSSGQTGTCHILRT